MKHRLLLATVAAATVSAPLVPGIAAAETAALDDELGRRIPVTARHLGIWEGVYRRYAPDGTLTAEFDSRVEMRFDEHGDYFQRNTYTRDGKVLQVIEASGRLGEDRLLFENERVEGWAADVETDPARLTSVLAMEFKDDSGIYCYEIIQLSPDDQSRNRATQCAKDGELVSRTLIDERRVE